MQATWQVRFAMSCTISRVLLRGNFDLPEFTPCPLYKPSVERRIYGIHVAKSRTICSSCILMGMLGIALGLHNDTRQHVLFLY